MLYALARSPEATCIHRARALLFCLITCIIVWEYLERNVSLGLANEPELKGIYKLAPCLLDLPPLSASTSCVHFLYVHLGFKKKKNDKAVCFHTFSHFQLMPSEYAWNFSCLAYWIFLILLYRSATRSTASSEIWKEGKPDASWVLTGNLSVSRKRPFNLSITAFT